LEAYKKYEQGRTARRQGNTEGLKEALKFMREAVELDPSFFWAWEELFSIYMESEDSDSNSQLRAIAKKLEQLNPNSAEAHAARAWIAYEDFEFARANNEFQRAIRLDPSRPRPHRRYGEFLLECGRLQDQKPENADRGDSHGLAPAGNSMAIF
jgi:Tfp pilus assembly protein PilF